MNLNNFALFFLNYMDETFISAWRTDLWLFFIVGLFAGYFWYTSDFEQIYSILALQLESI